MADEKKDLQGAAATHETADERSEKRYQDLIGKLKESSEKNTTLENQIKELSFSKDWDKLLSKYPKAQEHFEEIKKDFLSGKPVEEAAVVILHRNNKLMTADQIRAEGSAAEAVGGSADTTATKPRAAQDVMNDPSSTHEDRVKILRDLEAKGEIGLKL